MNFAKPVSLTVRRDWSAGVRVSADLCDFATEISPCAGALLRMPSPGQSEPGAVGRPASVFAKRCARLEPCPGPMSFGENLLYVRDVLLCARVVPGATEPFTDASPHHLVGIVIRIGIAGKRIYAADQIANVAVHARPVKGAVKVRIERS